MPLSSKPKVLLVAGWYPSDESPYAGVFVRDQALGLAELCDVAVLHVELGNRDSDIELTVEDSILVARIGVAASPPLVLGAKAGRAYAASVGYLHAAERGYRALLDEWGEPDILHAQVTGPAGYGAWWLNRRHHIPYVITEHSAEFLSESGEYRRRGRISRFLMRRAGRSAGAVIAVSRFQSRAIQAHGIAREPDIIPNIVRPMKVTPMPSATSGVVVGHVSLMVDSSKDISGLLAAMRLVADERSDVQLLLAGDGPDRLALTAKARKLGLLGTSVEFVGPVRAERIDEFYARCHFTVVSSRYETFCMAAAESLMSGRAVLSTRCGGPEDFLIPTVGRFVPASQPKALALGLVSMADDIGRYGPADVARYAQSEFAARQVAQQIVEVYTRVISASG